MAESLAWGSGWRADNPDPGDLVPSGPNPPDGDGYRPRLTTRGAPIWLGG